eukprot:TRINITY_DN8036_c0_g2_i1.p1 TRINITY_DN8036_c0_g2~~TRINITY_DN8036_c0_g2_i1.p1  ORF type:complete len:439 (-),score=94.22 TRINITY_DN8036_c0_g2_i1:71-1387(-)
MPFMFQTVLSLCGQQVKVKNTFLDDVVVMDGVSEQTPAFETPSERASQTCPEFSLPKEEERHGNDSLNTQACDEHFVTLEWALHMEVEERCAALPASSFFEPLSPRDDAIRKPTVAPSVDDCCTIHMPANMSLQRAKQIQAEHLFPASLKPVLSTMPLDCPARDNLQPQHVDTLGRQSPSLLGRIPPPPAMPAPVPLPAAGPQSCPAVPPPGLPGNCLHDRKDADMEDLDFVAKLEHRHEDAMGFVGNQERPEKPLSLDQLPRKNSGKASRRRMPPKVWCHFFIDPLMAKSGFELNKKVIGHGGANTRNIFDKTDAKIRLRGCGSGHREVNGKEAPVHLMLAVTTNIGQETNFLVALQMSAELLQRVTEKYMEFCKQSCLPLPKTPCFWIGELSEKAQESMCLSTKEVIRIGDLQVPLILEGPGKKKTPQSSSFASER